MKPVWVWLVLWAMVVAQIALWAFAPDKQEEKPSAGDGRPYGDTEQYMVESRVSQRKSTMATLDLPWSSRCGEDRKRFIAGVNHYYYIRQIESEHYPEYHGKLGADYIARQWSTGEDKRIERLTQEAYARGYLMPSDFDGVAGKLVAAVVKDERVVGKGCAG
jgi:hypothetical protein